MPNYSKLFSKLPKFLTAEEEMVARDAMGGMGKAGREELERAQLLAEKKAAEEAAFRQTANPDVAAYQEGNLQQFPRASENFDPNAVTSPKIDLELPKSSEQATKTLKNVNVQNESKIPSRIETLEEMKKKYQMGKAGVAAAGVGGLAAYALSPDEQAQSQASMAPMQAPQPEVADNEPMPQSIVPKADQPSEQERAIQSLLSKYGQQDAQPKMQDISFGDQTGASVEGLKDAQNRSADAKFGYQMSQIGDIIGSGISGRKPTEAIQDFAKQGIEASDQPVKDYIKQTEFEKEDPNSAVSQGYRNLMKRMGINVIGKASASDLEKLYPTMANMFNAEQARITRHDDLMMRLANAKDQRAFNDTVKEETHNTKRLDQLGKLITAETASSRSAFGRSANTIRSAEAIERLAAGIDPNQLDTRQITEIARNLDAMLASGQATVSGMQKLIPITALGDASKIAEYIGQMPRGAQQGAFVKRMMDTVNREKELAKEQIIRAQGKIFGPYSDLKEKEPERFGLLLKAHDLPDDIFNYKEKRKESGRTIIKKGYNSSTDQTQLIFSDGSKQVVKGKL